MYSDAPSERDHMTTSSDARRKAEVALALALDESPHITHPATRVAVHAFVDALAGEGLMPEAVVIALKDLLLRNPSMHRALRSAWTADPSDGETACPRRSK